MKNNLHKTTDWLKNNKKYSIPLVAILIVILYFVFSKNTNNTIKAITIKPADFTQEVRLTGKVVAQSKVS
ncbi:hypothetical protein, partial [Campylobacter jejuni]|uniref:hypothetical protein n=1 Tax=Campylobacter jejuni TaxID=197 RepID=UPI001E65B9D9